MSNSIVMDANVLAFFPTQADRGHSKVNPVRVPSFDEEVERSRLSSQIEAECKERFEAEYKERLEHEIEVCRDQMSQRLETERQAHGVALEKQQVEFDDRLLKMDEDFKEERQHFEGLLNECSQTFDQCILTLRKEIQKKVVDLSISLAEVIVRHELPDRDMLHNLIVKTLEPVSDLQGVVVRISSQDWELFGGQVATGEHFGVGGTVKFAEDPNLKSGDVIVESRNGIFDARLDERLKLLKELLNERTGGTIPQSSGF